MDFDISKENIIPLRGGRNVSQLGAALQAQTDMDHQRELMQQQSEFERAIETYSGDDPLENWYNYISWVEQSYPKQGHEGNLMSLLERCLQLFEHDARYRDDRRLCKLFIKYIDQQSNPLELYHMMYASGLCRGWADMYKAWAYYYEAASDFQNAHNIFECAKNECAQPYNELQDAHENLVLAAGRHIIYGPNERDLFEKRQALTSLQTYKSGQVSSMRQPSSARPGTLGGPASSRPNAFIQIYEDRGQEARGADAGPISIIAAAKRLEVPKENTLKPGPWTTVPLKKKIVAQSSSTIGGPLCSSRPNTSIPIYEDESEEAAASSIIPVGKQEAPRDNILKPGQWTSLPGRQNQDIQPNPFRFAVYEEPSDNNKVTNFVTATLENYSNWIVSLTIPEPKDDRMVPMYPKSKVYSEINTEYSLEEIRASRYLPKKSRLTVSSGETNQAVQSILGDASIINYSDKFNDKRQNDQDGYLKSPLFLRNQSLVKKGIKQLSPRQNIGSSQAMKERSSVLFDNIWNPLENSPQKSNSPSKFTIYEQSTLPLQERIEPKGSAMKTPFKDLNAEELAETGSRGGMDVAAAAPVDSAKRLPIYDDDSSSFDKIVQPANSEDFTCNTQMFAFNLNAMQVSTPQSKQNFGAVGCENSTKIAAKQLFTEGLKTEEQEKFDRNLSTIFEETKSYGQSSTSSNSATTKSSSRFSSQMKHNNMTGISEEHNNYLAQNLMANAALRSSLLGDLMDFDQHSSSVPVEQKEEPEVAVPAPAKITPLTSVPSNPFKASVIETSLQRVGFPGPHRQGYFCLNNIPKLTVRKEIVSIGPDKYVVEKQLGKGTYGTVFRGVDVATGNTIALKFQKPPNRWEFYICRELRSRLANHPLRERFMDVRIGYFSDLYSVLISEFMPCGSLLDVANMIKQKSGRIMKESLCIHFCLEMLKVVQAMHEVQIIHADIKPDNFLVQFPAGDTIGLQLIDFGCSIDMSLYPPGASFTRKITTEDFICCEMLDNRPWNYHTDLFCVAATAHVLLFDKYIQLQKKDDQWSISNRLPRYARLDLWNMFFSTLLNQQEGPANSATLQAMLEDSLYHKFDDYHNDLRSLTNLLRNR